MPFLIVAKVIRKRSAGNSLLIFCTFCLLAILLSGCKPSYEDSGVEPPTPTLATGEMDSTIKEDAESFIKAVQSKDFAKSSSFLSADLQKRMPVAQLTEMTNSGVLKPLVTATNFKFEPVQISGKGRRATVRLGFDSSEQKGYKMNFIFEKSNDAWKINTIVPPAKYEPPTAVGGKTSASQ